MEADATDIDEAGLKRLVDRFYERVRADAMLGPVFEDAVDDWPPHLEKLAAFWSSVVLRTGRYTGNPMTAHARHAGRLSPAMFERWLALWRGATAETMAPAAAALLQARAERIAESLQLALFFRPGRRPARP
ncbi:hemoglobin [Constrictibacter sp. MBR-5]|jgi:hemoglobin|uniref:group III truncated hemoglobin n=1 Tax=Constrictibacter sp. MBR-5 TaxID=3156467 RepID=UPI003392B4FE